MMMIIITLMTRQEMTMVMAGPNDSLCVEVILRNIKYKDFDNPT